MEQYHPWKGTANHGPYGPGFWVRVFPNEVGSMESGKLRDLLFGFLSKKLFFCILMCEISLLNLIFPPVLKFRNNDNYRMSYFICNILFFRM